MLTEAARPRLLALHGFTLDGAAMRRQMGPLAERLERSFDVAYPDGLFVCDEGAVQRLWRRYPPPRDVQTPRTWWRASDDGRIYEGWRASCAALRPLLDGPEKVGIFGFSQGAMLASVLAALSVCGELPPLAFAILIAGAPPRAEDLKRYFRSPLEIPSLHVIGLSDALVGDAPWRLSAAFDPAERYVAEFDGGHIIPRRGAVASEIVGFAERYASLASLPPAEDADDQKRSPDNAC